MAAIVEERFFSFGSFQAACYYYFKRGAAVHLFFFVIVSSALAQNVFARPQVVGGFG
jgi:hypothetical protein